MIRLLHTAVSTLRLIRAVVAPGGAVGTSSRTRTTLARLITRELLAGPSFNR